MHESRYHKNIFISCWLLFSLTGAFGICKIEKFVPWELNSCMNGDFAKDDVQLQCAGKPIDLVNFKIWLGRFNKGLGRFSIFQMDGCYASSMTASHRESKDHLPESLFSSVLFAKKPRLESDTLNAPNMGVASGSKPRSKSNQYALALGNIGFCTASLSLWNMELDRFPKPNLEAHCTPAPLSSLSLKSLRLGRDQELSFSEWARNFSQLGGRIEPWEGFGESLRITDSPQLILGEGLEYVMEMLGNKQQSRPIAMELSGLPLGSRFFRSWRVQSVFARLMSRSETISFSSLTLTNLSLTELPYRAPFRVQQMYSLKNNDISEVWRNDFDVSVVSDGGEVDLSNNPIYYMEVGSLGNLTKINGGKVQIVRLGDTQILKKGGLILANLTQNEDESEVEGRVLKNLVGTGVLHKMTIDCPQSTCRVYQNELFKSTLEPTTETRPTTQTNPEPTMTIANEENNVVLYIVIGCLAALSLALLIGLLVTIILLINGRKQKFKTQPQWESQNPIELKEPKETDKL